MVPENPLRKNSIVDVRCHDKLGRQFIVEMQMVWSKEFQYRVLFNASKAYVRQLDKGKDYELLQPVYSLNLLNEVFEPKLDNYYHYYRLVHEQYSNRVIDGLHLVFVELVEKAISIVRESAFTRAQLEAYDRFWDAIRVEKAFINEGIRRGMEKGIKQGMEQGIKQGMEQGIKQGMEQGIKQGMEQGLKQGVEQGLKQGVEQGRAEGERQKALAIARNLRLAGMRLSDIARMTGLSEAEIPE